MNFNGIIVVSSYNLINLIDALSHPLALRILRFFIIERISFLFISK